MNSDSETVSSPFSTTTSWIELKYYLHVFVLPQFEYEMSLISWFAGIQSGIRQKSIIHTQFVCVLLLDYHKHRQQLQKTTQLRHSVKQHMLTGVQKVAVSTAATRYPRVEGLQAGRPSGSISWMKTQPIIRAENRCFQQRALHHYGPVGNEGKYQGPGIYDVAFWKHGGSDARAASPTREAIYRIKMEKQGETSFVLSRNGGEFS